MLSLNSLKLYSTSCCHLCDEAYALLCELKLKDQLIIIDVAENEALLAQYGLRIPVLRRTDTDAELNWPFNTNELIIFLEH